jgi:hypothetical protein
MFWLSVSTLAWSRRYSAEASAETASSKDRQANGAMRRTADVKAWDAKGFIDSRGNGGTAG